MNVSPPMKLMQLIKYCRMPFDLNAKPGDEVLVITDSDMDPNIWTAVVTAGNEFGCEMTVALMADPREHNAIAPPEPILEALKVADISISVTSKEFATGGFYTLSTGAGHKFIIMEETNAEMLTGPAVQADYKLMNELAPRLLEWVNRGGEWRLTSDLGMDYRCRVEPGRGRLQALKGKPGQLVSFPDGEFGTSPIPGSGEGVVIWDTSAQYPKGLFKEPIRLTIEKGRVKKIEGGTEARLLLDWIRQYGNEDTYEFDVEIFLGFNPKAPITGILRTDKKHYGNLDTAMGRSGVSPLHIDGITQKSTITVNGEVLLQNGVIMVPPFDTWA